jgi:hypothetical protein
VYNGDNMAHDKKPSPEVLARLERFRSQMKLEVDAFLGSADKFAAALDKALADERTGITFDGRGYRVTINQFNFLRIGKNACELVENRAGGDGARRRLELDPAAVERAYDLAKRKLPPQGRGPTAEQTKDNIFGRD